MDPIQTLALALEGDQHAATDYNAWINRGGFAARVKVDPGTDLWMRGVRYAEVRYVSRAWVTLASDGINRGKLAFDRVAILEGGE